MNKNSPENYSRRQKLIDLAAVAMLVLTVSFFSLLLFQREGRAFDIVSAQRDYTADLSSSINTLESEALRDVFDIPKIYVLPWSEDPMPVPEQSGYGKTTENGVEVLTYDDDTISVRYWTERILDSTSHFAEIWVAHPTQLRTAFADGEFGGAVRYTPQAIAQQVNAVIAINADYCGYRNNGVIIRQNTEYARVARGWDSLLIDSNGDFHIMADTEIKNSGVLEEYDIVNTFVFGPSLVVDGEINLITPESGCGKPYNLTKRCPRTAIGQIGPLHYLFCCVEGGSEVSEGIFTSEMAQIMLDKGCVQAYNLDGGKSTTMVFNGEAMNYPMWGGQRVVTDIVYCATGVPNE